MGIKKLFFLLPFLFSQTCFPAMTSDGTTGYATLSSITMAGTWTFSCWWYSNADTGQTQGFTSDGVGSGTNMKLVITAGQKVGARVLSGGAFDQTPAMPTPNYGAWHFVVFTRDSADKVDIYIDGGVAFRLFSDAAQTGNTVFAAIGRSGTSQNFNGRLDDVRLFSRVLSTAEISSLYNSKSRIIISDGRTGWWKFDEGTPGQTLSGAVFLDSSGNNHVASATGGVSQGKSDWINYP